MGGTGSYDPYRRDRTGGASPPDTGEVPCADVRFSATVQLPPEPIDVAPDEVLEVCLFEHEGVQIVGVFNDIGEHVGSIVDRLDQLLPCLGSGVAFLAEVITINYGTPSVRVMAASISSVTQSAAHALEVEVATRHGRLELAPPGDPLPMAVAIEAGGALIGLSHPRFCELRSLVRVGVPFEGHIRGSGEVELELAK